MPNCLAILTTRGAASPGAAPAVMLRAVAAARTQKCLRKFMLILPDDVLVFGLVALSSPTRRPGGKPRTVAGSSFMSDLVHRIETALAERFGEQFFVAAASAGL